MRRKKKKTDLKVYDATELKDAAALAELKSFSDEELAMALVQASNVEGYAIGLTQNHPDDQTIVTIGLQTAWLARVGREVIALQMFERAQAAGQPRTIPPKSPATRWCARSTGHPVPRRELHGISATSRRGDRPGLLPRLPPTGPGGNRWVRRARSRALRPHPTPARRDGRRGGSGLHRHALLAVGRRRRLLHGRDVPAADLAGELPNDARARARARADYPMPLRSRAARPDDRDDRPHARGDQRTDLSTVSQAGLTASLSTPRIQ